MVVELFFWILGTGALLAAAGFGIIKAVPALRGQSWRQKQLGIHNAEMMISSIEVTCAFCRGAVDPKKDGYLPDVGWFHKKCYEDAVS